MLSNTMTTLSSKVEKLEAILTQMESVLVPYSGGVDSTFLLKVASEVLGTKAIAVTATSELFPPAEVEVARKHAAAFRVEHLTVETNQLEDPAFTSNTPDRCYHCKRKLFSRLAKMAEQRGLKHIADGTNADDEEDLRPGSRAAIEFNAKTPLRDAGLTKEDIRILSRERSLPTWDKPSSPCLATRLPYGVEITRGKLRRIGQAEEFLASLGIGQLRVREHNDVARIEVLRQHMHLLLDDEISRQITDKLKALGYHYVTLDLQGYRMGSMNEPLEGII
jgi:uncharacterized protein